MKRVLRKTVSAFPCFDFVGVTRGELRGREERKEGKLPDEAGTPGTRRTDT